MSDRRGPGGPNLLLLALSLALAAIVAEGGLRLLAHFRNQGLLSTALAEAVPIPADGRARLGHMIRRSRNPGIIYEFKPALEVEFLGAPVRINSAGFRGRDLPEAKPPGTRRIVGLGDSFMFGHGVGEGEPYLQVLEDLLNERAAGARFEAVNTAVPGYNTAMEIATLEEKGLAYQPDVVLIQFVGNDLELPNFIRLEEPVLALDRSFLLGLLRAAARKVPGPGVPYRVGLDHSPRIEGTPKFASKPDEVPPEYRSLVGWETWENSMRRLAELGRQHGFEPALVSFSVTFAHRHQRVLGFARRHGIAVLEVGPTFLDWLDEQGITEYDSSPLALGEENPHPSPLGHRIAARVIYRWLCELYFSDELTGCELPLRDPPGGDLPAQTAMP